MKNMITDKSLTDFGLESYEPGYYQITDEISVDVEGNVRIENESTTRPIWIAQVISPEELKTLIECIRR